MTAVLFYIFVVAWSSGPALLLDLGSPLIAIAPSQSMVCLYNKISICVC